MRKLLKYTIFLLLAILVIPSLPGCGGGGGDGNGGGGETNTQFHVNPGQQFSHDAPGITLKGTEAVFPEGADVPVRTRSSGQARPVLKDFTPIGAEVTIGATAEPRAAPTLVYHNVSNAQDAVALTELEPNVWLELPIVRTGQDVQVTLRTEAFMRPGRGARTFWRVVLGKVPHFAPSTHTEFKLLAGSGALDGRSGRTIIAVPGFLSTVESMRFAAQYLVGAGVCDVVWGYSYDWRAGSAVVVPPLAQKLNEIAAGGGKVDLFAHSRGVLICRDALEVKGATKAVRKACCLAGPNLGCVFAAPFNTLGELLRFFASNDGDPTNDHSWAYDNDPAVMELAPNSNYLRELNQPHGQRGMVSYYLVAGTVAQLFGFDFAGTDFVVDRSSALAQGPGIQLEDYTGGTINRTTVTANHFSIHKTAQNMSEVVRFFSEPSGGAIELKVEPNPSEYQEWQQFFQWYYGWIFWVKLKNTQNYPVVLDDLSLDQFDRYGNWFSVSWYDPDTQQGEHYPNHFVNLNYTLNPGHSVELGFYAPVDEQYHRINDAPENLKAQSIVVSLRAHQNGQGLPFEQYVIEKLKYGSIWPADPHTRGMQFGQEREPKLRRPLLQWPPSRQ